MNRLFSAIIAYLALLATLFAASWLSWRYYTPSLENLAAQASALFGSFEANQEYKERATYLHVLLVSALALPLAVAWSLRARAFPQISHRKIPSWTFGLAALLAVIGVWRWAVPPATYDFYFADSFFFRHEWVFLLAIAPVGIALLWSESRPARRLTAAIGALTAAASIALPLASQIWTVHTDASVQHTGALLFPILQVARGFDFFVDAWTTYGGGFAYLLSPLFTHLMEPTVFHYSLVMTFLAGLSFVFLGLAWVRSIRSPGIATLAFSAALFFGYIHGKIQTTEPYYQVPPLRTLFPSLFFLLLSEYAHRPQSRAWRSAITASAILGFFWTPDAGIWTLATWAAVCLFDFLAHRARPAEITREALAQLGVAAGAFVATFGVFAFRFHTRQGVWPDFSLLFFNILAFGKFGIMGLPMPFPHVWVLFVAVYLAGLFWSVWRVSRPPEKGDLRPGAELTVFANAVFGLLTFTYYLGRSHDWNLIHFAWPAFFILGMAVDRGRALLRFPDPRVGMLAAPILAAACLPLVDAPATLLRQWPTLREMARARWSSLGFVNAEVAEMTAFIRDHVEPGERVLVFALFQQAQILSETPALSAFAPSQLELIALRDQARLRELLASRKNLKVFIIENHYAAEWLSSDHIEVAASPNRRAVLYRHR